MIYNFLLNLNLYSDHLLVNLLMLFILPLNSFPAFVIKYLCYLTGVFPGFKCRLLNCVSAILLPTIVPVNKDS